MKTAVNDNWRDRLRLRAVAGRTLWQHDAGHQQPFRTTTCGKAIGLVGIHTGGGGVHFSGVETCGSVWTCPVCAAKIAATRTQEVTHALECHQGQGGAVYFLTLTAPHWRGQACDPLRQLVATGWTKLINGAPWKRIKGRFGIEGYIRALETKHGANGWHNHLHVVLITRRPVEVEDLREAIYDRWARIIERSDGGWCSPDAMDLHRIDGDAGREMGWYLAKLGLELTQLHLKGLRGGLTPFQLLERGDRKSRALFREFAAAFKGKRHLTWSRGLKDRYGIEEISDEEIAMNVGNRDQRAVVDRKDYERIRKTGQLEALVNAAIEGGQAAVDAFLAKREIDLSTREALMRREHYYDGVLPEKRPDWLNQSHSS